MKSLGKRGRRSRKKSHSRSFWDVEEDPWKGLERWFEEITIYPRTCSILDTMVSIERKLRVV